MAFEIPKIQYTGAIKGVELGAGDAAVTVGAETSYPFHLFEGELPNAPVVAMEVFDRRKTSSDRKTEDRSVDLEANATTNDQEHHHCSLEQLFDHRRTVTCKRHPFNAGSLGQ